MIRFIEEHYREDISAADLSERFGLSASYISSLLKTALGVRYSDYVAGLRLNHAKELLAQSELFYKAVYRKRRLYAGGIQEIIWKMSTDA